MGAFCSFANGTDVVENHPIQYVSTHPFMYADGALNYSGGEKKKYEEQCNEPWYFEEIHLKGIVQKRHPITIGNDVWIGKNVIITNSACIGNGVIAAAGAVITKDVPDYAVVAGIPARIVRFRYKKEQIDALNKIAWWSWDDDKIRESYDDFFENIDFFLKKHYK